MPLTGSEYSHGGKSLRVVAIVQARMGSTRLPGKVLADIEGQPMLRILLARLRASQSLSEVVVATTQEAVDDPIAKLAAETGTPVVRGSSSDVLSRYVTAAKSHAADAIMRVTADCPLVDPALVDETVRVYQAEPAIDYVSLGDSFPEGADLEVFSRRSLELADTHALPGPQREHVTLWIKDNPENFGIRVLQRLPWLGSVRLTVDEPQDLDVIRKLVAALGAEPQVGIFDYARQYQTQGLGEKNSNIARNEGLWRSLNLADLECVKKGQCHPLTNSESWLARSRKVIPGATQTLSKGIDQFVAGVTPAFLERGCGAHVWDVDGNAYIDYPMALGPILLGYNHPGTVAAVSYQLARGTTFTLPHPLEAEVAEQVVEMVPAAEMVRFAKNGSDVTTAAVRLARAVTGRGQILVGGYHGWHDWYVGITPRNAGVPEVVRNLTTTFIWNDVESFERGMRLNPAAVIIELPAEDPNPGFLEHIRKRCAESGTIFIWDEIVTGFRWAPGGAQQVYSITPDLVCLGKAMANGLPLSAIAGRAELMREFDKVFFSGTFGGETLGLAAAKATLAEINRGEATATIWERGAYFRERLQIMLDSAGLEIALLGHPPRSGLQFHINGELSYELRGLFLQETVKRGILFGGPIFITPAHEKADLDYTLDTIEAVLPVLSKAVESGAIGSFLEGPAPGVVFRPTK